jgi:hypothetical protein
VVDELVDHYKDNDTHFVLRIPVPETDTTMLAFIESVQARVPTDFSKELDPNNGPTKNLSKLFDGIADKSETPIIVVLEQIQNLTPRAAGDILRLVRALNSARGHQASMRKLTVLLTGTDHPNAFLEETTVRTPYNIGEKFTMPGYEPEPEKPKKKSFLSRLFSKQPIK